MKYKIVAVMDAPLAEIDSSDKTENALLMFYKLLGWNPDNEALDPRKVRTTREVYTALLDRVKDTLHDSDVAVGALMVNYGPGVDDSIPLGKVHLLKGWVEQ